MSEFLKRDTRTGQFPDMIESAENRYLAQRVEPNKAKEYARIFRDQFEDFQNRVKKLEDEEYEMNENEILQYEFYKAVFDFEEKDWPSTVTFNFLNGSAESAREIFSLPLTSEEFLELIKKHNQDYFELVTYEKTSPPKTVVSLRCLDGKVWMIKHQAYGGTISNGLSGQGSQFICDIYTSSPEDDEN